MKINVYDIARQMAIQMGFSNPHPMTIEHFRPKAEQLMKLPWVAHLVEVEKAARGMYRAKSAEDVAAAEARLVILLAVYEKP